MGSLVTGTSIGSQAASRHVPAKVLERSALFQLELSHLQHTCPGLWGAWLRLLLTPTFVEIQKQKPNPTAACSIFTIGAACGGDDWPAKERAAKITVTRMIEDRFENAYIELPRDGGIFPHLNAGTKLWWHMLILTALAQVSSSGPGSYKRWNVGAVPALFTQEWQVWIQQPCRQACQ